MKKKFVLLMIVSLLFNFTVFADNQNIEEDEQIQGQLDYISPGTVELDLKYYIKKGESVGQTRASSRFFTPTKYFQNNQTWSDDYMETAHLKIGPSGCALTSFAMLASMYGSTDDPGEVNTTMGDDACDFSWDDSRDNYGFDAHHISWSTLSDTTAKSAIAGILMEEGVCIVGMTYSGGTHYVLARGYSTNSSYETTIYIYDPAYQNNYTKLQDYFDEDYTVHRIVYYDHPDYTY
ncbi:MAG: C39 family peptidase [Clostridiales bacterium]|nr:C39 family peptidase [Clostridiales bacterium]